MNILVFSWRDHKHPQAGGAEQVIKEHIKGWMEGGHNVTLFSSRFEGSQKHEKSEGVEIFHRGDQYIGVKIEAFKFWLKYHEKFDLVVDQFHGIPFFTPFYVRKPKLAVLQEVAREVWFLNGFPWPFSWIIGVVGYLFEPLIFVPYRKIPFVVGSQSAKKDLVKVGIPSGNISLIPHGVIVDRPEVLPKKEKIKTLLFLGALTKDKGIEDAIKAFSLLNKKGQYRFWVVGKGGEEYQDYLKNMVIKKGLEKVTIFWGYVDDRKKFDLLARSHLLINPSMREGWGLVNIEANSVGTPVIAYKSPGLVDSVKENVSGVFCESSPKAISGAVTKVLENYDGYLSLSQSSIKWAGNFEWGRSKKMSRRLIESLVNK